jgi:putative transposase
MEVSINSVWDFEEFDGFINGQYRVLAVLSQYKELIIFPLIESNKTSRPKLIPTKKFEDAYTNKQIRSAEYNLPSYHLIHDDQIDIKHLRIRDKNFSKIEGLIENISFLYDISYKKTVPALTRHALLVDSDRKSISRLLNRYWLFGQNKNAFLPAYKNCGAMGKHRIAKGSSLGAPTQPRTLALAPSSKFLLQNIDKDNIRKSLKKHHLRPKGKSLRASYKEMLREYYASNIRESSAFNLQPHVPSYRQFTYWKSKLFSADTIIKSTFTERDYLQNKRALLGHSTEKTSLPGSCFEIDATVADIHIVSEFGNHNLLGRPTIYSVVDRASRMIVGFHVSLYYASWQSAQQALANCFLPKSEYCKRYGINITDAEWPCSHIPQRLICDNGEMIGLKPNEIMSPMTELSFAPPYRPDAKGIVEQTFRLLNIEVTHDMLGSTRGGQVVRGSRDPRKDAIYTLNEVITKLIEAVLEHNRSIFDDLATSNRLIIDNDLSPTPINFWNIHMQQHQHALKKSSSNEICARLLSPVAVSMTESGILYRNLYYTCEYIEENNLGSIARTNGRWSMDARVNEDTTDSIYVRLTRDQGFTECRLLHRSKNLAGVTMADIDFSQDWLDKQKKIRPISVESIDVRKQRVATQKLAKSRLKNVNATYTERSKDIRANRNREIESQAFSKTTNDHLSLDQMIDTSVPSNKVVHLIPRSNRNNKED